MWTHDGNFVEIYFSVEPPKVAEMAENGPEISSVMDTAILRDTEIYFK
jgi:hypothetical protein